MPSRREFDEQVGLIELDIVGQDGDLPNFIRHTGLAKNAGIQQRREAKVFHMSPPLEVDGEMAVDAVGSAGLNDDEVYRIKDFVARHEAEHAAVAHLSTRGILGPDRLSELYSRIYCVCPHTEPCFEVDGRYARMKFSCAGFVFEAYKAARILLFDVTQLPLIGLSVIKAVYPRLAPFLDREEFRSAVGLTEERSSVGQTGEREWAIMLCGYLLHATNRDDAVIRESTYLPRKGDENFPNTPGDDDQAVTGVQPR